MNRKHKKMSLFLISLLVFILAGCEIHLYDTYHKINEGEKIFVQAPSGTVTEAVYKGEGKYSITVSDFSQEAGAFVKDGRLHWVPEYTNGNTDNSFIKHIHATDEWGKPTKAPVSAAVKDIMLDPDTGSNLSFITLDIFDENGQKVDGRTHIYGTSSDPSISFYNFDDSGSGYIGESTSTIFGDYNLDDMSIFTQRNLQFLTLRSEGQEEGVVGFLVDTGSELPYFELELYSGEKLAANLVDKVDVFLTPLWPQNQPLVSDHITKTGVTLTWPLINEIVGITPQGYDIYQDDEWIQTVTSDVDQYDVTGLMAGTKYQFDIKAKYNNKVGKDGLSIQVTTDGISIHFNSNGGTNVDSIAANHNLTIEAPANPTKSNHTFVGWFKDAGFTEKWDFAVDKATETTTLYAKWVIQSNNDDDMDDTAPTPPPVLTPTNVTKVIHPAIGGSIGFKGAEITIPDDAFDREFKIMVEQVSSIKNDWQPRDFTIVGTIFEITKDKAGTFTKPVRIQLPFDMSKVDLEKVDIALYWLNEETNEWVKLDNIKIDLINNWVSGEVNHFTKFAVLTKEKKEEQPGEKPAVGLTDITGHWAQANIEKVLETGAVTGYPDGEFKPDQQITRAEFVTIAVKALGLSNSNASIHHFSDTESHWAKESIAAAYAHNVTKGFEDGMFRPNQFITREQMAVMIVNALRLEPKQTSQTFKDQLQVSAWATNAVSTAVEHGILNGFENGMIKPKQYATRAEAITIIVRALEQVSE